jgi:hypothetical protein
LHELDKGNLTGVRSERWVGRTKDSLSQVEAKIEQLRTEVCGAGAAPSEAEEMVEALPLLRLEAAVDRLKSAIGRPTV